MQTYDELLNGMEQAARDLIEAIGRERSGKRDGDGYWHGSEPLSGNIQRLDELYAEFFRLCKHADMAGIDPHQLSNRVEADPLF